MNEWNAGRFAYASSRLAIAAAMLSGLRSIDATVTRAGTSQLGILSSVGSSSWARAW